MNTQLRKRNGEISLFIPLKLKKPAGRCMILEPENDCSRSVKKDSVLLKALVRAHLWQRQLNEGKYANIKELSIANNMAPKSMYLRTVLWFNFLAPEIKRDIINGTQPSHLKWTDIKKKGVPLLWSEQIKVFYGK